MRFVYPSTPAPHRRQGKVLVLFALLLPVLLGMLGITLDGGLLLAAQRQTQNAADSAALAAAVDLLSGRSTGTATTTATTYVQQHNALANATVVLNSPPTQGAYAGRAQYVEVVVTYPVQTVFIQVLGVNSNQQVQARAVAGWEAVPANAGVAALDPSAQPGLSVAGGTTLRVNGRVVINSQAAGWDQSSNRVDLGQAQYAATTGGGSVVRGSAIQVVGGVDTPGNFRDLSGNPGALRAGALPETDPFKDLPTPKAGLPGVNTTSRGDFQQSSGTWPLQPGFYGSIAITGSANVTFAPGVYILQASGNNALTITTSGTVTGNGVMFYNTGSNFNVNSGNPDAGDREQTPPAAGLPTFGDVTITGPNVNLTGLNAGSPFDGMLLYQRRWNTKAITIGGNAGNNLKGTLYAKWAPLNLSGSGTFPAQFLGGSLAFSGSGNITVDPTGQQLAKANRTFLVE